MRNWIWVLIVIIIVAVIALIFLFKDNKVNKVSPSPIPTTATSELKTNEATGASMEKTYTQPPAALARDQISGKKVRIKTVKGDIVFELYDDAPRAASNFIFLTNEKFYDGLTFHRREEGFVIQGGDPNGNGTGGPGYKFADEPVTRNYQRGIVAMANAGPNTNGSQFFIMLADAPTLPKNYTIFGKVVSVMDVVDKIEVGDVMESVMIE